MSTYIGLADCNSFYASCETLFRPDLTDRPIVVLSNNDGCIVALSKEAKDLGIQRGVPYFKVKAFLEKHNVSVFSSNYTLYQDISDRVMQMISLFSDSIEIYSIDECFFHKQCDDYIGFASDLSSYLRRGIGVPVSVGIARTKTLAKIANHMAKKGKLSFFLDEGKEEEVLRKTPIDDIWGIGYRSIPKCISLGVRTAWDFASLDDDFLLKTFTVTGYNTALELRGKQMIGRESPANLSFSSSISFANPQSDFDELRKAVACHVTTVCEKLYAAGCYAGTVGLQLLTNRFGPSFTNAFDSGCLDNPSNYVPDLLCVCERLLQRIFVPRSAYRSVRVIAWDICRKSDLQLSLFDYEQTGEEMDLKENLSELVRQKKISCLTASSVRKQDLARRDFLSPMYTTRWSDLPSVGLSDDRYIVKNRNNT